MCEPTASKGWSVLLLAKLYQVRENIMSTLDSAKLESLKDKHLAQEALALADVVIEEKEKEDVEEKKGKGRRIKSKSKK